MRLNTGLEQSSTARGKLSNQLRHGNATFLYNCLGKCNLHVLPAKKESLNYGSELLNIAAAVIHLDSSAIKDIIALHT